MRAFQVGDVEVSVIMAGKKTKAKRGEYIVFDDAGQNPIIVSKEVYEKIYKEVNNGIHPIPKATIL